MKATLVRCCILRPVSDNPNLTNTRFQNKTRHYKLQMCERYIVIVERDMCSQIRAMSRSAFGGGGGDNPLPRALGPAEPAKTARNVSELPEMPGE